MKTSVIAVCAIAATVGFYVASDAATKSNFNQPQKMAATTTNPTATGGTNPTMHKRPATAMTNHEKCMHMRMGKATSSAARRDAAAWCTAHKNPTTLHHTAAAKKTH